MGQLFLNHKRAGSPNGLTCEMQNYNSLVKSRVNSQVFHDFNNKTIHISVALPKIEWKK
jgi:hypothetical protein